MNDEERLLKEHVLALSDLWRRERLATRQAFAQERAEQSLGARVRSGLALSHASVDETDAAPGGRARVWIRTDTEHLRMRPGSPVRITPNDGGDVSHRGTVARLRPAAMSIVVNAEALDDLDGTFDVELEAPEATFDRGDTALRAVLSDANELALQLFLVRPRSPIPPSQGPLVLFDEALEEAQQKAVHDLVRAPVLGLVHGPPGTGKTTTLVEVVRQLHRSGQRVLVTAASNAAVDHLGERLVAAGVDVLRMGHPARVADAMESHQLDARIEASDEWALARTWSRDAAAKHHTLHQRAARGRLDRGEKRALFEEARRLRKDARRQIEIARARIVESAQIICATAAGADTPLLADAAFDCVVLDEATQAPDPIALVALLRAPKAILAGDPCQLPPTVIDPGAERDGLGTTFFERLAASSPEQVRRLRVQYRMNEAIMRFPSDSMYESELVAADSVRSHTLADLGAAPDQRFDAPFVFIDTAGKGFDEQTSTDDPSTRNPEQARRTVDEVQALLSRGVLPEDLAVITPYDAQARLLRERLGAELRVGGLEVGTIDGFQGREKEAIVLDLVRSNADGALGFLQDIRRMNVALTRARRCLVVIGDGATLASHPFYAQFMTSAAERGLHLSAWVV